MGVPGEKPLRAEKRTNKLNPHMTLRLKIEPRPHWWEASALTTMPPLLSSHQYNLAPQCQQGTNNYYSLLFLSGLAQQVIH